MNLQRDGGRDEESKGATESVSHQDSNVVSIQIGEVRPLVVPSSGGRGDRWVDSGIAKERQKGPVRCETHGLVGDHQADLQVHGGVDKAVLAYSEDHFPHWAEAWGRPVAPGAFGENLTLRGVKETNVCIGDRFRLGGCLLEVSQPRQPCYKLAAYQRRPELVRMVIATGYSGWYFRVVEPGPVEAGESLELRERPWPQWSIAQANSVLYGKTIDSAAVTELFLIPQLSSAWKRDLG